MLGGKKKRRQVRGEKIKQLIKRNNLVIKFSCTFLQLCGVGGVESQFMVSKFALIAHLQTSN